MNDEEVGNEQSYPIFRY